VSPQHSGTTRTDTGNEPIRPEELSLIIPPALESLHNQVVAAIRKSFPERVVKLPLESPHTAKIDLSPNNELVASTDCQDNKDISALLEAVLRESGATHGIGGYDEKRGWYARGEQFSNGEEVRSIHLGIDIWAPAGETVYAPYDGVIHSAQDNALFGDYGPTVIVTHELEGVTFHTLYGHLSRESLPGKTPGTIIKKGEQIGTLGAPPINGDWPPHLHFQIITDMLGKVGDYPGVAAESQRERYLLLCPDPNLIVRSPLLA
jgi:murein DD-endopeptidase MepM/ murein hydrolase activator NlpD